MDCKGFDSDSLYKNVQIVRFPTTYVGMSSVVDITLNEDLNNIVIKTRCRNHLITLKDARKDCLRQRNFLVEQDKANQKITAIFHPTEATIRENQENFNSIGRVIIINVRALKVTGEQPCCTKESHLEIARIYLCGAYEFCKIAIEPSFLNVGIIAYGSTALKRLTLINCSKVLGVRVEAMKVLGITYSEDDFLLNPCESKELNINIHALSGTIPQKITFLAHSVEGIDNPAEFCAKIIANVKFSKKKTDKKIESLHKLTPEVNYDYVFCPNEIQQIQERKEFAKKFISFAKVKISEPLLSKSVSYIKKNLLCESVISSASQSVSLLCQKVETEIIGEDLRKIICDPKIINFGNVAMHSQATKCLKIYNYSKFKVKLKVEENCHLNYTDKNLKYFKKTLNAKSHLCVEINLIADEPLKSLNEILIYTINEIYSFEVNFKAKIEKPKLDVQEKFLKFGMVTSENFITNIPIKINNKFNIKMTYKWYTVGNDVPIVFLPESSYVDAHSFRIVTIRYSAEDAKLKPFVVIFESNGFCKELEATISTKKNAIRFSENFLDFKEIPLNIQVSKTICLENISKEIATFNLIEDYPGMTVTPKSGIILPKMVIPFIVTMKIPFAVDISFELCVKINNKDTINVAVTAMVVAPKLSFLPKIIPVPRIYSGLIYEEMVVIQNLGKLRTSFKYLSIDDSPFTIVIKSKNSISAVDEFDLDGKQVITLCIQLYYPECRSFDLTLPLVVNDIIFPLNFSRPHELPALQEFNRIICTKGKPAVTVKEMNWCRLYGIFLKRCILIQPESIEFNIIEGSAAPPIEITILNVSLRKIFISIEVYPLKPWFQIEVDEHKNISYKEYTIEFELNPDENKTLKAIFLGNIKGSYHATAPMTLDQMASITYNNLTFYANVKVPVLEIIPPVIFMSGFPDELLSDIVTLRAQNIIENEKVEYSIDSPLSLIDIEFIPNNYLDISTCQMKVKITVSSLEDKSDCCYVNFKISSYSKVQLKINYLITVCPLTRHLFYSTGGINTSWPYFPKKNNPLHAYLTDTVNFLERWLYVQGFRKEMYPRIPCTFYHTSMNLTGSKGFAITTNFISFYRRVSGSNLKTGKIKESSSSFTPTEQLFNLVKVYEDIINNLRKRGGNIGFVEPYYLLNYDDFHLFYQNSWYEMHEADQRYCEILIKSPEVYKSLSIQSWIDLILQIYRTFILNNIVFRDIPLDNLENHFIEWYNKCIQTECSHFLKTNNAPVLKSLKEDMFDCIGFTAVTIKYCPFLLPHFNGFALITEKDDTASIIHNTNILIEAWQVIKINFPLEPDDLIKPNYLQILMLSIHLYVLLPELIIKQELTFTPPLGQTSTRVLTVTPITNEYISYTFNLLNDKNNVFNVMKQSAEVDSEKKKQEAPKFIIKFHANFLHTTVAYLVLSGCNKLRIFDTFLVIKLIGSVGAFLPFQVIKVVTPINRTSKIDLVVKSPYSNSGTYSIAVSNVEPAIGLPYENNQASNLCFRRIALLEKEVFLYGNLDAPTETDKFKKVCALIFCVSPIARHNWIWFRSSAGEFFIKLICSLKTEVPLDSFEIPLPVARDFASRYEFKRTIEIEIPQMNIDLLNVFRSALSYSATPNAMHLYDSLMGYSVGRIILKSIIEEEGTNMDDIQHIFKETIVFSIKSKTLKPLCDKVTISPHSKANIKIFIFVPEDVKIEDKHFITLTSECGKDIRTYKILFTYGEG